MRTTEERQLAAKGRQTIKNLHEDLAPLHEWHDGWEHGRIADWLFWGYNPDLNTSYSLGHQHRTEPSAVRNPFGIGINAPVDPDNDFALFAAELRFADIIGR